MKNTLNHRTIFPSEVATRIFFSLGKLLGAEGKILEEEILAVPGTDASWDNLWSITVWI